MKHDTIDVYAILEGIPVDYLILDMKFINNASRNEHNHKNEMKIITTKRKK